MAKTRRTVRTPSTGDSTAPSEAGDRVPEPDATAPGEAGGVRSSRAHTHASVQGERAPRQPHERDESSDSGTGAPREIVQRGHDDVVAGRTGTDKGEATDEVYRRTLRDRTPGKERD